MDTQYYDDIIIGGGKAGKTLAPALVADGRKTALVERSLNMIGGLCPNIACIPAKRWWQVQKFTPSVEARGHSGGGCLFHPDTL